MRRTALALVAVFLLLAGSAPAARAGERNFGAALSDPAAENQISPDLSAGTVWSSMAWRQYGWISASIAWEDMPERDGLPAFNADRTFYPGDALRIQIVGNRAQWYEDYVACSAYWNSAEHRPVGIGNEFAQKVDIQVSPDAEPGIRDISFTLLPKTGTLIITAVSENENAARKIYIDGRYAGTGSATVQTQQGTYTVSFENDDLPENVVAPPPATVILTPARRTRITAYYGLENENAGPGARTDVITEDTGAPEFLPAVTATLKIRVVPYRPKFAVISYPMLSWRGENEAPQFSYDLPYAVLVRYDGNQFDPENENRLSLAQRALADGISASGSVSWELLSRGRQQRYHDNGEPAFYDNGDPVMYEDLEALRYDGGAPKFTTAEVRGRACANEQTTRTGHLGFSCTYEAEARSMQGTTTVRETAEGENVAEIPHDAAAVTVITNPSGATVWIRAEEPWAEEADLYRTIGEWRLTTPFTLTLDNRARYIQVIFYPLENYYSPPSTGRREIGPGRRITVVGNYVKYHELENVWESVYTPWLDVYHASELTAGVHYFGTLEIRGSRAEPTPLEIGADEVFRLSAADGKPVLFDENHRYHKFVFSLQPSDTYSLFDPSAHQIKSLVSAGKGTLKLDISIWSTAARKRSFSSEAEWSPLGLVQPVAVRAWRLASWARELAESDPQVLYLDNAWMVDDRVNFEVKFVPLYDVENFLRLACEFAENAAPALENFLGSSENMEKILVPTLENAMGALGSGFQGMLEGQLDIQEMISAARSTLYSLSSIDNYMLDVIIKDVGWENEEPQVVSGAGEASATVGRRGLSVFAVEESAWAEGENARVRSEMIDLPFDVEKEYAFDINLSGEGMAVEVATDTGAMLELRIHAPPRSGGVQRVRILDNQGRLLYQREFLPPSLSQLTGMFSTLGLGAPTENGSPQTIAFQKTPATPTEICVELTNFWGASSTRKLSILPWVPPEGAGLSIWGWLIAAGMFMAFWVAFVNWLRDQRARSETVQ
jgi:hypothetical protein